MADDHWENLRLQFLRYRATGDDADTLALFEQLQNILEGFFRNRVRRTEDAADLTQTTLLRLHMARHSYREELSLKTWVFTIASRIAIDFFRSRGHDALAHQASPDMPESGVSSHAVSVEDRQYLEKALRKLSPQERHLVALYAVDDLSVREIAEALGASEGAIKVRLHRVYQQLRKILGPGLATWLALLVGGKEIGKPLLSVHRITLQERCETKGDLP